MNYLHEFFELSLHNNSEKTAVEDLREKLTYKELGLLSTKIAERLLRYGTTVGDRIGIYLPKSVSSVAAILATLKLGAVYVPIDSQSPVARNAGIIEDCLIKLLIIEKPLFENLCALTPQPHFSVIEELSPELLLVRSLRDNEDSALPANPLAYILYTSGSTGKPKGVMYSHLGAISFIDWCSQTFGLDSEERFSSHAPFHFDLSIFDLYACFKHGGTLVLIDEDTGKQPMLLAQLIAEKRISVWYSTPSVLTLLAQYGKLQKYDYSSLKLVLFAGEVFPVKHMRALKSIWQQPRFFNLYGPTETNVCTYYEIPEVIPESRTVPFPIGRSCSHVRCETFENELCVSGPIMSGYWNQPAKTEAAYIVDASGVQWYKTGDIVERQEEGNFLYVGRKDRMVKRRGYRVELGEIEAALYKHPAITEAAVISSQTEDGVVTIKAFLNAGVEKISTIKMKQFSIENLPPYMIPDHFVFLPSLPKTSTWKTDYQTLKAL